MKGRNAGNSGLGRLSGEGSRREYVGRLPREGSRRRCMLRRDINVSLISMILPEKCELEMRNLIEGP